MIKILKSKKGMTLIEVILALAILGIISIPLIAVFSNSIFITQLTKRQIEINAVIQIAKGEVTQSVKHDAPLNDFDYPEVSANDISLSPTHIPASPSPYSPADNKTKFLRLQVDNQNLFYNTYKYKVKYVSLHENIVELIIELYHSNGKFLSEIKTDIYTK